MSKITPTFRIFVSDVKPRSFLRATRIWRVVYIYIGKFGIRLGFYG